MGEYLFSRLLGLQSKYPFIKDIRGIGLMLGIECTKDACAIAAKAMEKGLLINCTQSNILRVMPAMNVTKKMIDQAVVIIDQAMQESV